jgi:FAD-linked sulfhydryl oxidase
MDQDSFHNPNVWGAPCWTFLHCISYTYPISPRKEDKRHYKQFFKSLQYVLPCKLCREHYAMYLKKYPIEEGLDSRECLIKYLIHLHNHVNCHYKKSKKLKISDAKEQLHQLCQKKVN